METLFSAIGAFAFVWWVIGVILLTYAHVYIGSGAPWTVKFKVVFVMGWVAPWFALTRGRLPIVVIHRADDAAEERRINEWMDRSVATRCQCPECRARRGE